MNPAIVPPNEMVRPRMAVIPRLLAMCSYSLGALGAALSAFSLYGVLEAMRFAESAGIGAVTGGLAESNIPILVGLYAAIAGGFITIIVAAVRTGIATPPSHPPHGSISLQPHSVFFRLVSSGRRNPCSFRRCIPGAKVFRW